MVARDTQADLPVDLEAAGGGQEAERRGAERIGRRENNAAVVEPVGVGRGGGRTGDGEVPVEEVVGDRGGVDGGGGLGGEEFRGFFLETAG